MVEVEVIVLVVTVLIHVPMAVMAPVIVSVPIVVLAKPVNTTVRVIGSTNVRQNNSPTVHIAHTIVQLVAIHLVPTLPIASGMAVQTTPLNIAVIPSVQVILPPVTTVVLGVNVIVVSNRQLVTTVIIGAQVAAVVTPITVIPTVTITTGTTVETVPISGILILVVRMVVISTVTMFRIVNV